MRIARHKAAGLCVKCKCPAVPGRTLCEGHAEEYRAHAQRHKEKIRTYKKSIREIENARKRTPEYKEKRNATRRQRKAEDPAYAVADRLRKRIGRAVRDHGNGRKDKKTAELVGCSIEQLMAHLERQFLKGMSWDNRAAWHIEHIRPCASFDLTDPNQQKACFRFTNLRPLWAKENIAKHAKLELLL